MKYSYLLVLFASFALMGCKTTTINTEAPFDKTSQNGLVVLSLTQEEPLMYTSGLVMYKGLSRPYLESGKSFRADFIDTTLMKSNPIENYFGSVFGELIVAELPADTYEIRRVRYYINALERDFIYRDNLPTFEVKAGEITYLGEYGVKGITPTAMPAMKIIKQNSKKRDFEVLRKKYPNIKGF